MGRYPVRDGLAVPIEEIGFETVSHQRKVTNNHHLYFDRAWYMEKRYRQVFRGLLPHVQTMNIEEHNVLHDRYSGPPMPRDALMIEVVDEYLFMNGVIDVVRESKTCETYQIEPSQWQSIKGLYRMVA